jgi:hypothetical protein
MFSSSCIRYEFWTTGEQALRHAFEDNLALYTAWDEKGIDWRSEVLDLLKHWTPVFQDLFKKKRVMTETDLEAYSQQLVNSLLL